MAQVNGVVVRFSLYRVHDGWRGHCPICSGDNSFQVVEQTGHLVGSCSACGDESGLKSLLLPANRLLAEAA
jgi:uncharacterized protein (DUF983 family)